MLEILAIVYLIIIGDKYPVYIIQLADQPHPFVETQQETGSAERVGREGGICDDRDTVEIILTGISGLGIKDVVILFPVCFKITLVDAGGYDGFVGYADGGNGSSRRVKRLLDADVIVGPVGPAAYSEHISAQINDGMPDSLLF